MLAELQGLNHITLTLAEIAVIFTIVTLLIGLASYLVRMEIKDYVKTTIATETEKQSQSREKIYGRLDSDYKELDALMKRMDRDITTLQLTQNSTGEKMEKMEISLEKVNDRIASLQKEFEAQMATQLQILTKIFDRLPNPQ